MKHLQFTIPWQPGLCLRPAAELVRLARASRSCIQVRVGDKIADARNIFSLLLLCAAFGMVVDLDVSGEDEDSVLSALSHIFIADAEGSNHPL